MDRATIAYFVHGRGLGHASRALSIVPALRRAHFDVTLVGARDALPALRALGEVEERPLLRGGLSGWALSLRRGLREAAWLRSASIDAVLSDGDQAALLAARFAGLPSLAIGHDLVFSRCQLPANLDRRRLWQQRANALIPTYLSTRRVAVHFLPAVASDPNTRVARPELDPDGWPAPERRIDGLVCYFRDGNGAEVLRLAGAVCPNIICGAGQPGTLLDRTRFRQLLGSCTGVIASAGSNLLAECVLLGAPLLALYHEDDSEQALNAHWLADAGAGAACSFERIDAAQVRDFWQRARTGQFARVPLAAGLQSVSDVVLESLAELQAVHAARAREVHA